MAIASDYGDIYRNAYNLLNARQKEAVNTIEGPVITIAGPGTGKTQLLAIRIGKILMDTDSGPNNILCLTYTDAGVVAMRKRLLKFIGPEAYKVSIHTFHSFCNQIIKENIDRFSDYGELEAISDLEKIKVLHELIDQFGIEHPLKKLKGDAYREKNKIANLFSSMKREGWTSQKIKKAVDLHRANLKEAPEFRYKRKTTDKKTGKVYQIGDLNEKKLEKEIRKYDNILAASSEYDNFNRIMLKYRLFDFDDMILWVLKKFKNHPDFLADYQEQYHYILVDEYQDTNGSQNELLFLLADFWDRPNLFVVGDDDQAIYRFQGANVNNIIEFSSKYSPKEVVLTQNYRSSQNILDVSKTLIDYNQERLVSRYTHIDKNLQSATEWKDLKNELKASAFQNDKLEEAYVVNKIKSLSSQGVPLNEIAILYRNHAHADAIIKFFSKNKIPFNLKKKENVLQNEGVLKLVTILRYIGEETKQIDQHNRLLFDIMHFDEFRLSPKDIGRISLACFQSIYSDKKILWREAICNTELLKEWDVENIASMHTFSNQIESWIGDIYNHTPQILIEKILTESGILDRMMRDSDSTINLQALTIFYDFVKNESVKNSSISLDHLLDTLDQMEENNIRLDFNRIYSSEKGVNLITSHGSKGLEFDYVFLIKMTQKIWTSNTIDRWNYSIPPTLIKSGGKENVEDDRRLTYVSMTRARKGLHMSYHLTDMDDKQQDPSQFLSEIGLLPQTNHVTTVTEKQINEYLYSTMLRQEGKVVLIDHELIDRELPKLRINPTGLDKFLKCPIAFYFENILRVPSARTPNLGYGNAIHFALENFFRAFEKTASRETPSQKVLLDFFDQGMDRYRSHFTPQQFEDHKINGRNTLNMYYENNVHSWSSVQEFKVELALEGVYKDVPITGRIDLIKCYPDKTSVIDFKTGTYRSDKIKLPANPEDTGGDYWRQMVFYKILLDQNTMHNLKMNEGFMEFVEPNKDGNTVARRFVVDQWEIDNVGGKLVDTYQRIKNHEFEPGCGKDDCKWCNFVNRHESLTSPINENLED